MENAPLSNIEARFHAYAEKLSTALGHADRVKPFHQKICLVVPVAIVATANEIDL
jgi:hypothetical protein